jgi:hypothetical protein
LGLVSCGGVTRRRKKEHYRSFRASSSFSMITALTTFIEQPVRRKRELAFFRFPKK